MIRKIPIVTDEFYHIYNRGVDKRRIFLEKNDYKRFQKLLYFLNSKKNIRFEKIKEKKFNEFERGETIVSIGSYCLMSNHFHLLLFEKKEGGISLFLQKLCTAYSMYFNKKYDRTGTLFEGKFRSEHVDNDDYLRYLYSYICLNPIKKIEPKWKEIGIKKPMRALEYSSKYEYSSLQDHLKTEREEGLILNSNNFPDHFSNSKNFKKELFDWIAYPFEQDATQGGQGKT